jgi:hypothetical protein
MASGSRKRIFAALGIAVVVAGAFVAACVGEDAAPTAPSPDGGGANPTNDAANPGIDSSSGGPGDASSTPDSSTPDAGSDAGSDSGPINTFDAGPPIWNATLPAGTQTNLVNAGNQLCQFVVISVETAVAPPKWEVYLQKNDAPAAICNEPKGLRALGSSYNTPAASLLKPTATDQLVLAYSLKISPSGSAPTMLSMSQVDWWSGNDMHVAIMKTKAVVNIPATPSLVVVQLFFTDPTEEAAGTVRLKGTGGFPGETGTGMYFYAVYDNFISTVGQLAIAADDCTGGP